MFVPSNIRNMNQSPVFGHKVQYTTLFKIFVLDFQIQSVIFLKCLSLSPNIERSLIFLLFKFRTFKNNLELYVLIVLQNIRISGYPKIWYNCGFRTLSPSLFNIFVSRSEVRYFWSAVLKSVHLILFNIPTLQIPKLKN